MAVHRAALALLIVPLSSIVIAAPVRAPDGGTGTRPASPKAVGTTKSSTSVKKSSTSVKKIKPLRNPPVDLFQINTKESFVLRFADERGRPIVGWQKRFQRFMRCHHTNTQHKIDPRLPRLLYQTGRHFAGHRLEVISGYRNPKVARNPKSPHKKGLACDFRLAGIPNATLREYLRHTFDHVGVGFYPNSSFVHLDVRKGPSAFWIDYSGPGEGAAYSGNAREDLRTGKADWYRPAPGERVSSKAERAESVDDLMETAVKGGAEPGGDGPRAAAATQRGSQARTDAPN
ncbi:MAG: DUF882 domain-containing protein [Polyangia bacterium]